jgi:hypothetical protein
MRSNLAALAAVALHTIRLAAVPGAQAQAGANTNGTGGYTVIASVIFARTGERTPILSQDTVQLTPYGAQQMYNLVGSALPANCQTP